jgi:NitT/TauT family transport system substrate-binding protein
MTRMGLAALAVVMAFGCAEPASAQQKMQATQLLAVGIQLSAIREFVAKGMGFYDEENIEVQLVPALGSATEIQFMTAGRGTLGSIDVHMAVQQRTQPGGIKLRSVFSNLQSGVYRIGMLEEAPIRAPADLKGKKVGVPTKASGSFEFVRTVAKLAGVAEADMEVIPVGFGPAAADSVTRKRIDVLSTVFPDFNNLRYLADTQGQFKFRELKVPQNAWPTNALMITDDEAKNKRPMIVAMLRGFVKGHVFVTENPRAALMVSKKLYPELVRDDDFERQLIFVKWSLEEAYDMPQYRHLPVGAFDLKAWEGTERYYKDAGLIGPNDKLADVIDQSFIAEINNFDKERVRKMARDYK